MIEEDRTGHPGTRLAILVRGSIRKERTRQVPMTVEVRSKRRKGEWVGEGGRSNLVI
jgi:hypothetical protein